MIVNAAVFACHSAACRPPGSGGTGGSAGGPALSRKGMAGLGKGLHDPDSGFTMSPHLKPITKGFAVAVKGSDKLIDAKDAYLPDGSVNPRLRALVRERVGVALATTPPPGTKVAIGGWHNPADGKLEVNVTVVFPPNKRAAAEKFARKNDQISMARLHNFTIIDTGGTGGDRTITASADLVQGLWFRAKVMP